MPFTPDQLMQVVRTASYLKRFHTIPSTEYQTVAHHTWNMMALVQVLWPQCRKELLLAALYHDIPEVMTGDVPAPFKWANPEVAGMLHAAEEKMLKELGVHVELTESEKRMLAIADTLELVLYSHEQAAMGNTMYAVSGVRGIQHLIMNYGLTEEFKPVNDILEGIENLVTKPSASEYN